ncbi:hypothetical protein D5018_19635 [Parashewanella curva]|uniref:Sel1 repeat family protein n=1 Tax=Parashewanella curva TaxID=2338552 RepID=A0A3L8PRY3_9GAMM|nr:hypothetical protein [Parashewanella curva]RLV57994.1 hypothetical protein D5018_19635 [Parashewanella curva]
MFKSTIIALSILISLPIQAAVDCKAEFKKHLKTDLKLNHIEFDQTQNSGFRALGNKGCYKEAADLVELYIEKHNSKDLTMRWHVAQLRALSGDNKKAAENAKLSLTSNEQSKLSPLKWNDYVLASVGFFEGKKDILIHHRNMVAKAKDEHFGNELNLKMLDKLIKHFGKSYDYASNAE